MKEGLRKEATSMSTTTDRIALIYDCIGHQDTDPSGQPRLWRHRDGRYVSEDEAEMIAESTRSDRRQALNLYKAELDYNHEIFELDTEFRTIIDFYSRQQGETFTSIIDRLPPADAKRVWEIWHRIGPLFRAWCADKE